MWPWLEHIQGRETIKAVRLLLRKGGNKGKQKTKNLVGE
jgi:hypothetical protein